MMYKQVPADEVGANDDTRHALEDVWHIGREEEEETVVFKRAETRVLLLVVLLDMLAVGLVMPLVTPLIKNLGASAVQMGLISSSYGALQLISGPIVGLVSDRCGRKVVLLLSFVGCAAGYLLLGFSASLQVR
eukprot:jgi/Mesen1/3945/ME000209S02956